MKALVFKLSNWNFAIEHKLILSAISLEDTHYYPHNENSFEIEYSGIKTKVFDLAKKMSLINLEQSEKIIIMKIENQRFGILVNKIIGIKELKFEKLPPYLVLKGKIKPIEGISEYENELITLINTKILENLTKESQ